MTTPSAPRRLHACTASVADAGDLLGYLGEAADVAWIRHGDGVVGLGEAVRIEADSMGEAAARWAELAASIEHSTELPGAWGVGPVAFGSFAFDPAHSRQSSVLVVPRLIVGRRDGVSWVTALGSDADEARPELPEPVAARAASEVVGVEPAGLPAEEWAQVVAAMVERIQDGADPLEKVVLARALRVRTAEPVVLPALLRRLADAYPTCWTYHVDGLVGASPEMLIKVQGGLATSRVLAGTIRRDGGDVEALGEALSESGKDLEEHRFAVASVATALRPFCSGMHTPDEPFVLKLPNVLHLASDVTGVMKGDVSSLQLAGSLHPSAAVCGTPTPVAMAAIAEREQLDRGRYAGPVGWIDAAGDGEWAIALRCGRLEADDPRAVTLYAGCGIVGRSVPEAEVAETDAKFRPMLDALGA